MTSESLTIAQPTGWGSELDPRSKNVLDSVFAALTPSILKNITNAKYFNSGNVGVSFSIKDNKSPQWNLMYKPSRMGSNDLVRGTLVLQASNAHVPAELIRAPDSINNSFPSHGDIIKMAKKLTDILTK